jgi:hypothetical protein
MFLKFFVYFVNFLIQILIWFFFTKDRLPLKPSALPVQTNWTIVLVWEFEFHHFLVSGQTRHVYRNRTLTISLYRLGKTLITLGNALSSHAHCPQIASGPHTTPVTRSCRAPVARGTLYVFLVMGGIFARLWSHAGAVLYQILQRMQGCWLILGFRVLSIFIKLTNYFNIYLILAK